MTRDEIKNKIQLEITNVNKKISNKRRGIEFKDKINWRADMIFCMVSTQSQKKREGKRKKKKEKKSYSRPNLAEPQYTRHPGR